jgi:hypothetical protein
MNGHAANPLPDFSEQCRAECIRSITVEHVLNIVASAAFEEFAGIWQRLLMHPSCAVYVQRACMLCRRL